MTNNPLLQEIDDALQSSNNLLESLDMQGGTYDKNLEALTRLREFKASVDVEKLDEAIRYILEDMAEDRTLEQSTDNRIITILEAATKLREIFEEIK